MWVAHGRPQDALRWAEERDLSDADALDYLREYEHITLAAALLAIDLDAEGTHNSEEVTGFLERLLQAAEEGRRTGSAIQVLTLLALARQSQGDTEAALIALERAVTLAEPEGYVRVFLDGGRPLVALLEAALDRGIRPHYAERLLTAAGERSTGAASDHGVAERLSARELDVLRLLATDLSGPEIAR